MIQKLTDACGALVAGLLAICIIGLYFGLAAFILYAVVHFILKFW